MSLNIRKTLLASPAIFGLLVATSTAALANPAESTTDSLAPITVAELTDVSTSSEDLMEQVTSVSQLSDVQPTDWAYQALQSLVERYGCIAGYPDGTFRGNRAATRYEMAAALNACLDSLDAKYATKEDLAALKALMDEFAAELATLRGRVDALEARTATLEAQQFSTTTKLNGEVIMSVAEAFIDRVAVNSPNDPTTDASSRAVFTNRARLNFDTSFTGKDRLRTRLNAGNTPGFNSVTGTNMTRLGYQNTTDNEFTLGRLEYRFPFAKKGTIFIEAVGGEFNDNMETFNPYFESSARGALSRFGRFNPIYRLSGETGFTLSYKFIDNKDSDFKLTGNIGYLAANANQLSNGDDPQIFANNGLVGGPFGAIAQIDIQPIKNLKFGINYVYSQNISPAAGTGSGYGDNPFNSSPSLGSDSNNRQTISANNLGLQATYKINPKFNLSGWFGYSWVDATEGSIDRNNVSVGGDNAQLMNWAVALAFPDVWRKGDLAGIIFGMPPRVVNSDYDPDGDGIPNREDLDISYHLEALYRFQVTKNISITPGVIVIFNPNHNENNDTAILGAVRATFVF